MTNRITYTNDEIAVVEAHIQHNFGKVTAMHTIENQEQSLVVDIYIINPSEEFNFYTLVSMGMGANKMNVPPGAENLARAELVITLPPDWSFDDNSSESFWPVHLLRKIANLPLENKGWLSFGHTVENNQPFAQNTELSSSILLFPMVSEVENHSCVLPNGEMVNFYQIIPLYKEELKYEHDNDWESLLDLLSLDDKFTHVVTIDRPNYYTLFSK